MDLKDLDALASLAVNIRKLAKFQKQDFKDKCYPTTGSRDKATELFKIYDQLIEKIILHSKNIQYD
jgi:hypothetical protein